MELNRLSKAVRALLHLIKRLRGPNGCAWDAKQTDSTVKTYLLEEAYEVLDAVEKGSPEKVRNELGDLFFQILFLCRLAEERKEFDFVEVVEEVTGKMIRRHPHVFGNATECDAEEVARNWAKIKKSERAPGESDSSLLRSVPAGLPALLRAHRLMERASKEDFVWADKDETWEKAQNYLGRLRKAIINQDSKRIGHEIAGLLFALVNLARHWGLNAEDLLRDRNRLFTECFEKMESKLEEAGILLEEATPEEMKRLWEEVEF